MPSLSNLWNFRYRAAGFLCRSSTPALSFSPAITRFLIGQDTANQWFLPRFLAIVEEGRAHYSSRWRSCCGGWRGGLRRGGGGRRMILMDLKARPVCLESAAQEVSALRTYRLYSGPWRNACRA
jgi:hypothetical protein